MEVRKIGTKDDPIDLLTKHVSKEALHKHLNAIGVVDLGQVTLSIMADNTEVAAVSSRPSWKRTRLNGED